MRIPRLFLAPFLIGLTLLVTASCAGVNPTAEADTPEQHAYALYGEYAIVVRQVADMVCGPAMGADTCPGNPAIDPETKQRIAEIEARTTAVANALMKAALEVERIRAELAAGGSTEAMLSAANARLLTWINQLVPLLAELRAAIKGDVTWTETKRPGPSSATSSAPWAWRLDYSRQRRLLVS